MTTHLLYLEDMNTLEADAKVQQVFTQGDGRQVIVLDQTIFYPQGGGQPYDQGTITADNAVYNVEEVRYMDGSVWHIGKYLSGKFIIDQTAQCRVEPERRHLHMRLHSAGHVIDLALMRLNYNWPPHKGYHFPNGPYVEYEALLGDINAHQLRADLEAMCNQVIQEDITTSIRFMPKADMHTVCRFVSEAIPEDKPGRVVMYGDFGVPCGGTHVPHLNVIGDMTIRKVRQDKQYVRVAYSVKLHL